MVGPLLTFLRSRYMTVVMIAAELRVTVKLPVGDLSHFWPSTESLAEMEKRD